MRLPRVRLTVEWVNVPFRFTVRGMMIGVAILAVVLGVSSQVFSVIRLRRTLLHFAMKEQNANRRVQNSLTVARMQSRWAKSETQRAESLRESLQIADPIDRELAESMWISSTKNAANARQYEKDAQAIASLETLESAYYSQMRKKYEYAASHPWLWVPPDPPPPNP